MSSMFSRTCNLDVTSDNGAALVPVEAIGLLRNLFVERLHKAQKQRLC